MKNQTTQESLKKAIRMVLSIASVLVMANFAQAQTQDSPEAQKLPEAPAGQPAKAQLNEAKSVITCSEATENFTKADLINMLRGNTDFNTVNILLKFENGPDLKNWTRLTGYDEDKDLVSYKTTMVGKATNKDNGTQRSFIDECEASFVATGCRLQYLTCSGNSFPISKPK